MARKDKAVAVVGIGAGLAIALAFSRRGNAPVAERKLTVGPAKTTTPANGQTRAVTLAVKYGNLFGVPPSLVIAIFQIESANKADAVNLKNARGGAWGLGQMTLETAKDLTKRFPAVAKKYWPKFDGTGPSLLDPETNAAISAYHLSLLWKRYQGKPGNWLTTGLAYHQGSGNVDKQIAAGGGKVNPATLPPNGKTYYGWLQKQLQTNAVVAKAATAEQKSGAYNYA